MEVQFPLHQPQVITDITACGAGLGSFDFTIDETNRVLDLTKVFNSVDPIVLTFTVEHSTGPGNPYTVKETITNSTNDIWTDFHYTIGEPDQGGEVVFTQHNKSVLFGFSLDQSSRARDLNCSGSLASAILLLPQALLYDQPLRSGSG